ncbi:hypothetical protein VP01_248g7 [Puccinia sorghi]|uniref:Uncharacterized protein n=1 Tax=Puccinia sorghi TaxID=27349 RepID=A0A0L6V7P1_9BASI|nr:hypothetical protein VP01_248g7 [Puccinia sorghi]
MERRKRRRHSTKTKPSTNANHEPEQTAAGAVGAAEGEGARAGKSEFIKSLPASSLIKYLDKHHLLHSPLRTPTTAVDHDGQSAVAKKQLIEDYHRFALLVSCGPSGQSAADRPETSHLPSLGPSYRACKEPPPSSDISPSASAIDSHRSEASLSPSMARSTSSSSSFYSKLFSPTSELLDPQEQEGEEEEEEEEEDGTVARQKKKPHIERPDSLFQFDKTLTTIVQSHHHRTFPCLLQPHHSVDSNTHNPIYEPDSLSHTLLPLHPPTNSPSKSCATLTHHGFPFNIHLPHTPPLIPHPNSPSDHVRLIEDHVLPHFVYSVKTRGNALRPK